jgi:hypothetical protein
MNRKIKTIDLFDSFSIIENEVEIPEHFYEYINKVDMSYRLADRNEIEEHIMDSLHRADSSRKSFSSTNEIAFEKGWRENIQLATEQGVNIDSLKPGYFRSSKFLRYKKDIVITKNTNIEYDLFFLSRLLFFTKYLRDYKSIYEFGCGSCSNLFILSSLFPEKELFGLDWASSSIEITNMLNESIKNPIRGYRFDMLKPDINFKIKSESAILTIHAMEQLGDKFGVFLQYLIDSKPSVVIHYEPILEMYDKENLYDYLAMNYSEKRGYLSGYLSALNKLANKKIIEIIEVNRPYIGGVYHESSLVVWRPI